MYMPKFVCIYLCLGNENKGFEASETDPGSSTVKKDESEKKDAKEPEEEKKE